MGRNVFAYALGSGLAGGLDAYGEGLQREQQFEQQRQLQKERFDENERLMQMRGGYGGTGTTGQRAGAVVAPLDAATLNKGAAAFKGMTPEQLEAYERGDDIQAKRIKQFNDDGSSSVVEEIPQAANFDGLVAERKQELERLRKLAAYGKDYKDVADGEATDDRTRRLGRVESGNEGAAVAMLAEKGKGEFDGLNGGVGVFSSVRGGQELNAVGKSAASENNAQAGKASADAKKIADDAKAELNGSRDPEKLQAFVTALNGSLANGGFGGDERKQIQETILLLNKAIQKRVANDPGSSPTKPTPAPTPGRGGASAPKAPYKEGQRLLGPDGKTYVVRNGRPVPA